MKNLKELNEDRNEIKDLISSLKNDLMDIEYEIKKCLIETNDLEFLNVDWTRFNNLTKLK